MSAITIMNEDEIQSAESVSSEAGFGCVSTARGNLPVKALNVRANITGLLSEVTVRQTYVNRYDSPLEATYIFPLPDRAAVSDFKMIVGTREIAGELKERGQARREYQQAIDAGHRASIVEEERPDTFTMRVGNVEPGEEVTIEFKVTGPLIFADGEATFRFPLVVAPRYIPGTPLSGGNVGDGTATDTDAVPDASRITPPVLLPNFPSPVALSIECEIRGGELNVSNVRSSLHAVTLSQGNDVHHIAIKPGERVNRDFILRFDVGEDDVRSTATFKRDAAGDEGTFLVTLVPPNKQGEGLPRDIVFVLDRSGSMGGWKMVAARRAIGRMMDTLTPKDRFQVIVFDNESTKFGTNLIEGTNRNRYRAIEDLSKVDARGGTEMAAPIFEGLDMLAGGYQDRRRMLVLVTDGQVGNEQQIVAGVQQRQKNVSMFTVGIDQAVNAGFLNRLADIGGGRCELVESEDRLDDAMDRIHRTIDTPVLTEVSLSVDGVTVLSNMYAPERFPDLFAGAPVQLAGRFRGDGVPVIRATGAYADGSRWESSLRAREVSSSAISTVWARRKVRGLEDQYAKSASPALTTEITNISLRFGVLCRFTSWVAVDREQKIESTGDLRQVVQPVEQPAGWASNAMAPPPPSMAAPSPRRRSAPAPQGLGQSQSGGGFRGGPGGPVDKMMSWSESADSDDAFADEEVAAPMQAPMESLLEAPMQAPALQREEAPKKKMAKGSLRELSQAGIVKERARYRSPESVNGNGTDERSDVFLVGIAAFELLTGRSLFADDNMLTEFQNLLSWDPATLSEHAELTSDWLALLQRALQPDPARRHGSLRELVDDLTARFGKPAWPHSADMSLKLVLSSGALPADQVATVAKSLAAAFAADDGPQFELVPAEVTIHGRTGQVSLPSTTAAEAAQWLGQAEGRREFWK